MVLLVAQYGEYPPMPLQVVDTVVTKEEFRIALQKTVGRSGMDEEEIDRIVNFVMGLFGFDSFVIDNVLSTSDRDVFYMLEEARLLTTMRDEVTIAKGKIWRIHYWILAEDEIKRLAHEEEKKAPPEKEYNVYDHLDEDDWKR